MEVPPNVNYLLYLLVDIFIEYDYLPFDLYGIIEDKIKKLYSGVINNQKIFSFKGDSDAMIVRGLIKILATIYNETEIQEASNIDPYRKLELLNLKEHISSQRSNGLNSIILKIKEFLPNS